MSKNLLPVLTNNNGALSDAQLTQAADLHRQFPEISRLYSEAKKQEAKLRGKWFALCDSLRHPADGVSLNSKDMTLLLLSLGEHKARVSEIVRVASVNDESWDQYKQGVIGFRAVLAIARTAVIPEGGDGGGGGGDGDGPEKKPRKGKETFTVPQDVAAVLLEAFGLLIQKEMVIPGPYAWSYETTAGKVTKVVDVSFVVTNKPSSK